MADKLNLTPSTRPATPFPKLYREIADVLDIRAGDCSPERLLDVFRAFADRYDTDVSSRFNMGYYCIDADVNSLAALDETERRAANIAVDGQHPAAVAFELLSIEIVLRAFGIDPTTGHGHYTSGGTEANLTAMVAALGDKLSHRNTSLPQTAYDLDMCTDPTGALVPYEYVLHGALPLKVRPTVYLSAQTHGSIHKNARTLLGMASLRFVPVDKDLKMNVSALEHMIVEDRQSGNYAPTLVVGTVGATGSGIIDSLRRIAEVSQKNGLWFHVDAPWGGIAAFSLTMKEKCLDGIELADSITFDPHKTLVPLGAGGCGMFLTRHRVAAERSFNVSGHPVETQDFAYMSLQGSRVNSGLRVLSQLLQPGLLAARIEREAELGELLRRRLRNTGWTIPVKTPLPVVTATHPVILEGKLSAEQIVGKLAKFGILAKAEELRPNEPKSLRLGIISRRTTAADVGFVVNALHRIVN